MCMAVKGVGEKKGGGWRLCEPVSLLLPATGAAREAQARTKASSKAAALKHKKVIHRLSVGPPPHKKSGRADPGTPPGPPPVGGRPNTPAQPPSPRDVGLRVPRHV